MKLPVRMAFNEVDYVDYSVIDAEGRVIAVIPYRSDSDGRKKAMEISIEIVKSLNSSIDLHPEKANENFCSVDNGGSKKSQKRDH